MFYLWSGLWPPVGDSLVQVWISFMYVMFGIDVIDFQCQFLNLQYILCFIFEVGYDYI